MQQNTRQRWWAGDRTLTVVGVVCVGVVVLCAVAARTGAMDSPRDRLRVHATVFGEGAHTVGEDVQPGTYVSEGVKSPGAERCSVTTEPSGGGAPQAKAAERGEPVVVTLARGDGTVVVRGCQDFALSPAGR